MDPKIIITVLGVLIAIAVLVLLVAYICFFRVFRAPKRRELGKDEYDLPPGKVYIPYYDQIIAATKAAREMPHEDLSITSHDGLKLCGKYYEYEKGAPVELLFHGYRGNAERDIAAGIERCFSLGRSAVLIDQRASGKSEGKVTSFGINEYRDCLAWVDFAVKHFGDDVKIVLTGVSMGAATVMIAAGEPLPKNVVSVLADCGYSSAREIIKKVIREMKLPANILYPFVKLGAKIFGGFDLDSKSPMEAMKNCQVPIIFIHGDADDFVPADMSRALSEACTAKNKLTLIEGAGHGIAYLKDKDGYVGALRDFEEECGFMK